MFASIDPTDQQAPLQNYIYAYAPTVPESPGTVPDFFELSGVLEGPSIAVLLVSDEGQTLAHTLLH